MLIILNSVYRIGQDSDQILFGWYSHRRRPQILDDTVGGYDTTFIGMENTLAPSLEHTIKFRCQEKCNAKSLLSDGVMSIGCISFQ